MNQEKKVLTQEEIKIRLDNSTKWITDLETELLKAKLEHIHLQRTMGEAYKIALVRKYMAIWNTGRFPRDKELEQVIFYLANLPLDDEKTPKTELKFLKDTNSFKFSYFNERLQEWVEVK